MLIECTPSSSTMTEETHRRIKTNGIWLHVAEKGSGPLVLLLHGFPELWFSWRNQISFLAENGYHVVAPDLRGYGDSDSPPAPTSYTAFHLVGDLIGLLHHFGVEKAFVVGNDWGAVVGWHMCLLRPDRLWGFVSISVPYVPRNPHIKPVKLFKQTYGDGFYISQFQEPGRAERAFAKHDYLTVMKKFLLITQTQNLVAPPGMDIIDHLETPSGIPEWITEEQLQVYAKKFQKTGFTGPFNYYRVMDLNWELLAPWQDSKVMVPDLEVVVLHGHHFIQQEKPQEVSEEILSFLRRFDTN